MEQFDTRFKQVDVLPMVKYFMDKFDLFNLFAKYVPAAAGSLAEHAQSLCILIANIICDKQPLYGESISRQALLEKCLQEQMGIYPPHWVGVKR